MAWPLGSNSKEPRFGTRPTYPNIGGFHTRPILSELTALPPDLAWQEWPMHLEDSLGKCLLIIIGPRRVSPPLWNKPKWDRMRV
jgi:hypothetical protein